MSWIFSWRCHRHLDVTLYLLCLNINVMNNAWLHYLNSINILEMFHEFRLATGNISLNQYLTNISKHNILIGYWVYGGWRDIQHALTFTQWQCHIYAQWHIFEFDHQRHPRQVSAVLIYNTCKYNSVRILETCHLYPINNQAVHYYVFIIMKKILYMTVNRIKPCQLHQTNNSFTLSEGIQLHHFWADT